MRRLLLFLLLIPMGLSAQIYDAAHRQYLDANHSRVGVNRHCYEFSDVSDTPAPKGYQAFYISHYGRHGSRSITKGVNKYQLLTTTLAKGQALGILTPAGEDLYRVIQASDSAYGKMDGRLTDVGEQEQRQLAERMYRRFPGVFSGKQSSVRAVSTLVPRCLISMAAFTQRLTQLRPQLSCDYDCGEQLQSYLNNTGGDKLTREAAGKAIDSLLNVYIPRDKAFYDFSRILTTDTIIADKADFINAIYSLVAITPCFGIACDMYDYLPARSIYRLHAETNYDNCVNWTNVRGYGDRRAQYGTQMLSDFIRKADAVIAGDPVRADLRFGHDHPLLVIASRMGIEGVGSAMNLEDVDRLWYGEREVCMASNVQVVFYRNRKRPEDILVKVLYNERECHLTGLVPVSGYYYHWEEVKQLWQ